MKLNGLSASSCLFNCNNLETDQNNNFLIEKLPIFANKTNNLRKTQKANFIEEDDKDGNTDTFTRRNALRKHERKKLCKANSVIRKRHEPNGKPLERPKSSRFREEIENEAETINKRFSAIVQIDNNPNRKTSKDTIKIDDNKMSTQARSCNTLLIPCNDFPHFLHNLYNKRLKFQQKKVSSLDQPQQHEKLSKIFKNSTKSLKKENFPSLFNIPSPNKKGYIFDPQCTSSERPQLQTLVRLSNLKRSRVKDRWLFLYKDLLKIAKLKTLNTYKCKEEIDLKQAWVRVCNEDVSRCVQIKGRSNENVKTSESLSLLLGWVGCNENIIVTYADPYVQNHWYNQLISKIKRLQGCDRELSCPVKVVYEDQSLSIKKILLLSNKENSGAFLERCLKEFRINRDTSHYQLFIRSRIERYLDGIEIPFYLMMTPLNRTSSWPDFETYFCLQKIENDSTSVSSDKYFFGRPLEELVTSFETFHPFLIQIFESIYLHGPVTDGIFRKVAPPSVKKLKEKIDKNQVEDLKEESIVNLVSLLKNLLRSLPDCLLMSDLYEDWIRVFSNEKFLKKNVKKLLSKLPQANVALLFLLLILLKHLSNFTTYNRMNISSLSTCISLCILWPPMKTSDAATSQQLDDAKVINELVQIMIQNVDQLFIYEKVKEAICINDISIPNENDEVFVSDNPFSYLDFEMNEIVNQKQEEEIKKKNLKPTLSLTCSSEKVVIPKESFSKSSFDISNHVEPLNGLCNFSSDGNIVSCTYFSSPVDSGKDKIDFADSNEASIDFLSSTSSIFRDSSSSYNSSPTIKNFNENCFKNSILNSKKAFILNIQNKFDLNNVNMNSTLNSNGESIEDFNVLYNTSF